MFGIPGSDGSGGRMIAACNEFALYFYVLLFNVLQFQLNRNVFQRRDDEFFVRNLESIVD